MAQDPPGQRCWGPSNKTALAMIFKLEAAEKSWPPLAANAGHSNRRLPCSPTNNGVL